MTSNQSFIIALVVIIGGGLLIRFPPVNVDPAILIPFATGSIGTVLGFVFGGRASRETAAAIAATTAAANGSAARRET